MNNTKDAARISNAVIKRLPRYRRYLLELSRKGVDKISSNEFSALIGYTASQIRQDFNTFGGFGQQGYGYNVDSLCQEISAILGLDKSYKMVLIGCGNLGQAIASYTAYYKEGFEVQSIFEINPRLIGMRINDIEVRDYEDLVDFVQQNQTDIGVICATKANAQEIADKLCFAGVKGIWNFATVDIEVPDFVALENVQISDTLHALAYHINQNEQRKEAEKRKIASAIAMQGDAHVANHQSDE